MTEHIAYAVEHDGDRWGMARCSCGWEQAKPVRMNGRADPWSAFEAHREEALKPTENACRYCASPIPWGRLFCADSCEKAARKKPDPDALATVLAAHRDDEEPEVVVPHPDQGALW